MLTPASVQSGKALERRVDETALVERHSALAENLLPWIAVLTVAAAALLWVRRRERREPDSGDRAVSPPRTSGAQRVRVAIVAIAFVAVTSAIGSAVQVILIGHSGSEAAWSEVTERGR